MTNEGWLMPPDLQMTTAVLRILMITRRPFVTYRVDPVEEPWCWWPNGWRWPGESDDSIAKNYGRLFLIPVTVIFDDTRFPTSMTILFCDDADDDEGGRYHWRYYMEVSYGDDTVTWWLTVFLAVWAACSHCLMWCLWLRPTCWRLMTVGDDIYLLRHLHCLIQ